MMTAWLTGWSLPANTPADISLNHSQPVIDPPHIPGSSEGVTALLSSHRNNTSLDHRGEGGQNLVLCYCCVIVCFCVDLILASRSDVDSY